jgi:hypothetical protein
MMEGVPAAGFIGAAIAQLFQTAVVRGHGDQFLPYVIDVVEAITEPGKAKP